MKHTVSFFSALMLAAVLLAATACSKAPSDTQVASDIQNKLNADSGLAGKLLMVQASNGTVTLSGSVDNDAQRDAAAKYASSEPGVKQVVNNLQIGAMAPSQQVADQPALAPMAAMEDTAKPSPAPRSTSSRRRHEPSLKDRESATSENSTRAQNMPPTQSSSNSAMNNPPSSVASATAPPPPPPPVKVTMPSGTTLSVRLVDAIDSETSQEGQTFTATLNSALSSEGDVVLPAGHEVEGHIVTVQSAGKFKGQSLIVLQLDRIKVGGKRYDMQTNQYEKRASSRTTNTAEKVGGGAVLGAIIGGIAGGGKGAGIGAAAGAGLGGGVQAATKSKQIKLPSETVLNFTLQAPLTVFKTSEGPDSGRRRLDTNNNP